MKCRVCVPDVFFPSFLSSSLHFLFFSFCLAMMDSTNFDLCISQRCLTRHVMFNMYTFYFLFFFYSLYSWQGEGSMPPQAPATCHHIYKTTTDISGHGTQECSYKFTFCRSTNLKIAHEHSTDISISWYHCPNLSRITKILRSYSITNNAVNSKNYLKFHPQLSTTSQQRIPGWTSFLKKAAYIKQFSQNLQQFNQATHYNNIRTTWVKHHKNISGVWSTSWKIKHPAPAMVVDYG